MMAKAPRRPRDPDGRTLLVIEARGDLGRTVTTLAARPWSFEWLASPAAGGNRLSGPQEHAGRRARAIWEAAGGREPSSPLMDSPWDRTAAGGPSEGFLDAIDHSREFWAAIGMAREARLRAFLVGDLDLDEMTRRYGFGCSRWEMLALLRDDLDELAKVAG